MKAIKKLLVELGHLQPISTGLPKNVRHDTTIRAIIFDIYGTLMISASGDVDEAEQSTDFIKQALEFEGIQVNQERIVPLELYRNMLQLHKQGIANQQEQLRQQGFRFPEIDILAVCQKTIDYARQQGWITFTRPINCRNLIFVFELLSNRVSAMPGIKQVINRIHQAEMPLGIVSNAQFYTPILLNYYLNNQWKEAQQVPPFDPDISVFSYLHKRGKPDTELFQPLLHQLKDKYQLEPHQALYIGNDMLKDVYTASQVGMKTCLFAGDKRSLRLRKDDTRVNGLKPDYTVNNLMQVLEIIGLD